MSGDDLIRLLTPLFEIGLTTAAIVCVALYIRMKWDAYKARKRAEGGRD